MKPKIKVYFAENTGTEKLFRSASKDFPVFKKFNSPKTKNIIDYRSSKFQWKKNDIIIQTMKNDNIPKTKKLKKSLSFTYKYFNIETKNKHKSLKDKSAGIKSIKENKTMLSNFISLSKEANIYTSNANYIKNKRMQLFEINNTDEINKTSFSERISSNKNNKNFLYKTTYFRGGKYHLSKEKRKKRLMKRIDRNTSIEEIVDYLEQNRENLNLFGKKPERKNIIIENNFQQKESKNLFLYNNSLYKEIMNKKEEILDSIINNHNYNTPKTKGFNLLSKKENKEMPFIFPKILTSSTDNKSNEQNSSYQYILQNFLRIKNLLEKEKNLRKNNEYDYIKEFLERNNIDKKYINPINIVNFSKYLNLEELPLDINKSLKENILLALNYNEEKEIKDHTIPKKKITLHKIIKKDINKIKYNEDKKRKNHLKKNHTALILDLPRQKKLYKKEEDKTDIIINQELKEEINKVEDEINKKQEKIREVEHKLNLIPFSVNYFNNKKKEEKNNKKENPIQLRLVSIQEIKNNFLNNLKFVKKPNVNEDIFNSNERLYYTWFRDKRKGDINNFLRRTKLTEFVVYNKTKEKILKDKLKEDFLL